MTRIARKILFSQNRALRAAGIPRNLYKLLLRGTTPTVERWRTTNGEGFTPYVGEVLDAAFSRAQAVVVLFGPDDLARLRPELCGSSVPSDKIRDRANQDRFCFSVRTNSAQTEARTLPVQKIGLYSQFNCRRKNTEDRIHSMRLEFHLF
jgi:hypothetical protein